MSDPYDDDRYDDPGYESELAERAGQLLTGVMRRTGEIRCLTFAATVDATRLRGSTHPAFLVRPDFTFVTVTFDEALRQEADRGYPTYHGLAAIAFWSVLEAFTEDICLACLELEPALLLERSLTGKVVLKELVAYAGMGEAARRAYLLALLDRFSSDDPEPSYGKTRLGRQLRAFDLSIQISKNLSTALAELYAVRNILAHRNGRVDHQFLQLCPWTRLAEGVDLRIADAKLDYYSRATMSYAALVTKSVFDRVSEHAPNLESLSNMLAPSAPFPFG